MTKWTKEVRFKIEDVLQWELYKGRVSSALVDAAGDSVEIPEECQDTWFGEVRVEGDEFVVVLTCEEEVQAFFNVLRLHRDDVGQVIEKEVAMNLTDAQMEYIAGKLGDAWMELGFWDVLGIVTELCLGLEEA